MNATNNRTVKEITPATKAANVKATYRIDALSTHTCHNCRHADYADDIDLDYICNLAGWQADDSGTCDEHEDT